MSRGNYHWSLDGGLHPGVDPNECERCEADLMASLLATETPTSDLCQEGA